MGEARFRSRPASVGDDSFTIDISDDGQVFRLTFGELQAEVDAGKSPDVVAARVFSLVLPLDGAGTGADISFAASGYALVSQGARGFALLSVNGRASDRAR